MYSGDAAFRLYDTYGLPMDFILDSARDLGVQFDEAGFERAMHEQRTRARASWKGGSKDSANPALCEDCRNIQDRKGFLSRHHGR